MDLFSAFFALFFFPLVTLVPFHVYGYDQGGMINQSKSKSTGCNLFQGNWVVDDSYPLYDGLNCPFVNPSWNCQKNGRTDKLYLKYRWQPTGCSLSRFNGLDFLQRLRGKKIMFVGDSLSRNNWDSLACLLYSALPTANYTLVQTASNVVTISFQDYRVSVMYMATGFLVDLVNEEGKGRVLKLDSLSLSDQWKGIDILIFNSYHWWLHTGRLQRWDYIEVGGKTHKDMDRMAAYKIGLKTWANWVDSNIHPTKTAVFFQGISAVHLSGNSWGDPSVTSCDGETRPIRGPNFPGNRYTGEDVIKQVLAKMKKRVYLLDIALLTQLRKDGHPSRWGATAMDCSHWCLAGVPDTWNQILYNILVSNY